MRVLGIESSCDETAAAVVEATGPGAWQLRSSVVASQVAIHREWGGVVPELAARQHLRDIVGVVGQALDQAQATWAGIDAIAVTQGPGLVGSLLVGVSFAKAVGAARNIPVVPVHHLAGHIESLVLHNGELPYPAIVLVVSGGHTSLYHLPSAGVYQLVGRTRDDAAGEAYDKVAKLVGLGYPGGPIVDRRARQGNPHAIAFPIPKLTHDAREPGPATHLPAGFESVLKRRTDFSFSGLKTAVRRHVELATDGGARPLTDADVDDICASFQRVVVQTLLDRTFRAAEWFDARAIGIAGGVAANAGLRAEAERRGAAVGLPVFVPSVALATDNAAMIAAAGLRRWESGTRGAVLDFNADPSLSL
ncbi:tRNA N6-adenosine threonylcarbamoyltransferase [Luteitalea sp. TBR-22]|uniref:tRNA (adenosine(37)-N6)-threonylcarbamoyltransferase complex transferase subunit TsaD n=1 Tax=Luteitalea sp. TBR-22 TaxID=2802971 RepID=UPI001AF10CD0|nr:tRNA (adenosine(37)-N6)-threonylcarbamoyltransferase complex transferase subunit TsaD [Luteitalea sp. TBR-22]BCS34478.1 tRNA N6-adenosine threonylcarbamoyltransferase [Luteitalea sp. TBR-22]